MKILNVSILVFIVAIFVSCDCLQHIQGTVIDAETRLPIKKVMLQEKNNARVLYTDSLGNFEFTAMTGGLFGCHKISLSFEKEGYIKTNEKYKSCCTDNVVVVLEKQAK